MIRLTHCRRPTLTTCWILSGLLAYSSATAQDQVEMEIPENLKAMLTTAMKGAQTDKTEFADFEETVKDTEKMVGLFTLYKKKGTLYAAIRPDQFGQQFVAPMAIARGMASAGVPLNFGDEWIVSFKRVNDQIQLIRENIRYEAPPGSPLEKAVQQNYTDSVLMVIPIVAVNNQDQSVLIDLGKIFLSDFAQLGIGMFDRERSSWHKVKAFPNNIELQVEATYALNPFAANFFFGDTGVIDTRGVTLVLHYSLCRRPPEGYKPRFADYRVGYFISATRDFGSDQPDTTFRRRVNRWRLEKANPEDELSPPKRQIVWWVENTVPHEYRPYVEQGILEWNKAFEKIGFRNALGVRWQNDNDEFDAEDINYCTFRWITTPMTFAMSGLRADPITGEMIDGDVIFDASWIRAWRNEYALLVGQPVAAGATHDQRSVILDVGEVISPMLAAKRGFGLPISARVPPGHRGPVSPRLAQFVPQAVPGSMSAMQLALSRRLANGRLASCQCAIAKQHEYALAFMALAGRNSEDSAKEDKPGKRKLELPEELLGQAIKEVVMHEVGHSLGLRHNFRASTIRSLEEINDPKIVETKGMVGSVMDYNPLNIARRGAKQGPFAATSIGPYDYWAIEYAYKPLSGNEEEELKKIAARSPEPDLTFGTDEDLYGGNDPTINAYDLGNDPLAYARFRMDLAKELLQGLEDKIIAEGDSWARLQTGFSALLGQFGNAAYIGSSYIGGQYVARDAKGAGGRDPVRPVEFDKQREALKFLVEEILSDKNFKFSPQLLRKLTSESWYHWGSDSLFSWDSGYDVYQRILAIQRIALNHCLDAAVLKRIQNQALLAEEGESSLGMAELFRALTDGVWQEVDREGPTTLSVVRRNLQREHVRRLCRMVIGNDPNPWGDQFLFVVFPDFGDIPADARSLARMHLAELHERITKVLAQEQIEDLTKAHLQECQDLISKTLRASVQRKST